MERIKEALTRARKERDESGDPAQRRSTTPADRARNTTPSKIEYTETRVIPRNDAQLDQWRVVAHRPQSPAGEAYKVLRTRVLQRMTANAWSSIAVTSPTMGNGKTVTAVNLAISLAREVNHTVLLVDFDLKRPNVHNFFTDEPALGISDYFSRDVPLAEILFNPGIDRLVVLPGNEAMEGSSEVLLAPKMRTLVDDLKSRYPNRIVIFDLPPALFFDDVLAFSPYIDAVLMVAEEGVTTKQQLQQACRMIDAERLCGVVLNKSQVPRPEMNMQYGYGVR